MTDSSIESNTTCNRFDDFVPLVVTAVAGLEGDLVGSTVRGLEPRLQESGQVLQDVVLEGLARSSYLDEIDYFCPVIIEVILHERVCCNRGTQTVLKLTLEFNITNKTNLFMSGSNFSIA